MFVMGMSLFSVLLYSTGEICNNYVWKPSPSDTNYHKDVSITDTLDGKFKNKRKYKAKAS